MEPLLVAALVICGLLNLLPVLGLRSRAQLEKMYGVPAASPDLELLLRHRALLFGLLGGLLLAAAALPGLRAAAIVGGLVSMGGFVLLAWQIGGASPALARVVRADVFGVVILGAAAAAQALSA